MTGIIVGVDGSDHSRLALHWAMREAVQRGVPLTVLAVHQPAVRPATEIYWNVPELDADAGAEQALRKSAEDLAGKVASDIGVTVPEMTVTVATGDPASELLAASREADLLVVGSRGSGGFARLLMGSVSGKVVHYASCPVVVVPGDR